MRRNAATSRSDGGLISALGHSGGVVAAAGLTPIHPHLTPWPSARRRMPWMRRTVPGASGRPLTPPLSLQLAVEAVEVAAP